MKNIRHITAGLFFLIILLTTACNPDGPGIFYTVATEQKINTSELSDKPIYGIVNADSRIFVLAGAAIYYQDGTSWEKITAPVSDAIAVSIAQLAGSDVYGVYEEDSSGSISETIYKLDTASMQWQEDANTAAIADSINLSFVSVDNDSNIVFISIRTGDSTYGVYSYDGTNLIQLNDTDLSVPVNGAAVLSSTYYLTASDITTDENSSVLYSTDGITASSLTAVTVNIDLDLTAEALGGITEYASTSTLYLSTKSGNLYESTDGASWTQIAESIDDSFGDTAELGDMRTVTYNGSDYLIIAANNGYFEMNLTDGTAPVLPSATAINFDTYDLSQETVFSLYTETDKIYLGSSEGLWLAQYNGGIILDQE